MGGGIGVISNNDIEISSNQIFQASSKEEYVYGNIPRFTDKYQSGRRSQPSNRDNRLPSRHHESSQSVEDKSLSRPTLPSDFVGNIHGTNSEEKESIKLERIMLIWDTFFENASTYQGSNLRRNIESDLDLNHTVVDSDKAEITWFHWILVYDEQYLSINDGYYVLNKVNGSRKELHQHIQDQENLGIVFDANSNEGVTMRSIYSYIEQGWMTFYDVQGNRSCWLNVITNDIKDYLDIFENVETIYREFGLRCDSFDPEHYPGRIYAEQCCSDSWIVVMISESQDYYYHNRLTLNSQWNMPVNYLYLKEKRNGWTLCCREDAPCESYWWNEMTSESIWYDEVVY